MIVTAVRNFGTERAEAVAAAAAAAPHPYVTGFGLAGDEAGFPPAPFARAFEIAHDAGLGITCHAGEWAGPESVRGALALPVPSRGSGTACARSRTPRWWRSSPSAGPCSRSARPPTSSWGPTPDFAAHPFGALRAAGVRVTLGSDDPPYWRHDDRREYAVARDSGSWATTRCERSRARRWRRRSSTRRPERRS